VSEEFHEIRSYDGALIGLVRVTEHTPPGLAPPPPPDPVALRRREEDIWLASERALAGALEWHPPAALRPRPSRWVTLVKAVVVLYWGAVAVALLYAVLS
jgi:hypothetical protein